MFESLISSWFEDILKSLLGEYVEGLDAQKLSISFWSGNVTL